MVHKIRSGIYYLLKYLVQSSKPSDTYCVALYKMQLYFKLIIIELISLILQFSWAANPNYQSYLNGNQEKVQSIPIFVPDPCYKKAKVGMRLSVLELKASLRLLLVLNDLVWAKQLHPQPRNFKMKC